MASQLGYSLFNEVQEQTNSNKRKNKTIKKKPPKPSSKVKNFLNAMAETQNVDEDNDGLADFQPPAPPKITKQPEDIKENFQMEDIGITPEAFQSLDNFAPQREHYNNYVPYFTNNQASVQKKDKLLEKLNCEVVKINCNPNGDFSHNPEPLDKNLTDLKNTVTKEKADLGIAVDPDVDRLVFVCEDGVLFGEENTLVACSDFVLSKEKGSTVSNMSSTLGLKDVTERYGCEYFSSKVGEVNVVEMMKAKKAIIGGEGNGGVIYPESHYGRDALVGIVLFLSYLVEKNQKVSMILNSMPSYFMLKEKISLDENVDIDSIFLGINSTYDEKELDTRDGIKINKNNGWIHLRKSNTEPIIRIYIEAADKDECKKLYDEIKNIIDINS